jgi:hypothetical protein
MTSKKRHAMHPKYNRSGALEDPPLQGSSDPAVGEKYTAMDWLLDDSM